MDVELIVTMQILNVEESALHKYAAYRSIFIFPLSPQSTNISPSLRAKGTPITHHRNQTTDP